MLETVTFSIKRDIFIYKILEFIYFGFNKFCKICMFLVHTSEMIPRDLLIHCLNNVYIYVLFVRTNR